MFKRMSALLWLRFQIILSNKSILLQILLPFAFVYFYKYLLEVEGGGGENELLVLLATCLPFSLAMAVGNPVTVILSEEKEKGNLRTLLMSGIKRYEYLVSTLVFPFFLTLIIMGVVPWILGIAIESFFNYGVIVFLTSIVIVLIYLFLGLVTRSQVEAQIVSVPALLLIAFLPMLSSLDKTMENFVDYSFMGLFTEYMAMWQTFSWNESFKSLLTLCGWIVFLIGCNFLVLRRNRM